MLVDYVREASNMKFFNIKSNLLISILLFSIISCTIQSKEPSKTPLTTYITEDKDLVSQEPYINYKVGFNNILIDPKDNDKSFIIRDGKILAFIEKDKIFLYSPDKSSPFEDNAVIKYYYKEPAIQYNSRETIYYDKNLDGIDIELSLIHI